MPEPTPHVARLGGRGWDCNQFLVKDPKSNAFDVIDAGHGLDFDRVLAEIAAVTDPRRIRVVAVTHEHLDHVNGLPRYQQLGAKVAASHGAAAKLREGRDPTSEMFGSRIVQVEVDHVLGDGDHLRLGDRDFAVLEVPGHSPGSACYWDERSGTLFSGDTLFAEGGIGRFDFPDGDLGREAESILRLGRLPVRALHCGHGPSVEGEAAARSVQASVRHVQACVGEA
jgi:hydroxyacylglutathione hydrolase